MFDSFQSKSIQSRIGAGAIIALSGLVGLGGCSSALSEHETAAAAGQNDGYLGSSGMFDFYLREVGSTQFIIASRYSGVAMIEHHPSDPVSGGQHTFSCEPQGVTGNHEVKLVTIDGTKYLFAERYNSCELLPMPVK